MVVNDNYEGLAIYSKDLTFKKNIFVDEDLMVYQLFSSEKNDFVILEDSEKEVLYSVNIQTNQIEKINWDTIVSPYYYVEDDMFHLSTSKTEYVFSYQHLALLERRVFDYNNEVILANDQKDILVLTASNELIYNNHVLEVVDDADFVYSVREELIVKQSENRIYRYWMENWASIFEIEQNRMIRSTVISTLGIYVLINDKADVSSSIVKMISLPVEEVK